MDYKVDLLVLGMGAAAELAAIYAHDANPDLNILIATKALKGKGGCSRMVQGGFNVVLDPGDSHEKHLMDTLKGGQYINDQDLACNWWSRPPTVRPGNISGCFLIAARTDIFIRGLRRPVLRPHGPQGRPDGHRNHQPDHRTDSNGGFRTGRNVPWSCCWMPKARP
ncbi:MAG: FAD-binding protein [Bilophila wadsworthia]